MDDWAGRGGGHKTCSALARRQPPVLIERICQILIGHESPRVRWIGKRYRMAKAIIEVVLDQLPKPIPIDIEDIEVMAEAVAFEAVIALRGKWLPGGVQLHPHSQTRWQFTMEHAIRDVAEVVVAESVSQEVAGSV